MRPGDAQGIDGRSWVEWEADPGTSRTEYLVVSNYGDQEVEFRLTAADGYFTENGRFNMLPAGRASTGAGTWISVVPTVTVPAGGSQTVPYTIAVPADAAPGDQPAGIAASIRSQGQGTVSVDSRVGFRVMTRVTGELRTEASAAVSGSSYTGAVNPFDPGTLEITYDVTNTGNTRLRAQPVVSIAGPLGLAASQRPGEEITDIAPGETRTSTLQIGSAWPLLWYDVRVEAVPLPVADGEGVAGAQSVTASASVPAMPWSQLLVLAAGAALVTLYLWQRRRDRARTARLVAEARSESAAAGEDAESAATSTETRGPFRRRAVAPTARLMLALALGLGAAGAAVAPAPVAYAVANDDEPSGIFIEVVIPPDPDITPTPTPTTTPSPAPAGGGLAGTGASDITLLAVGGGALLVGGLIAFGIRTRRARR